MATSETIDGVLGHGDVGNESRVPSLARLFEQVSRARALDGAGERLLRVARGAPKTIADRAADMLGHPAHPALTDLPIGFWTSAWVLDVLPGRRHHEAAARQLIALGLLSTVPTIVTGLGDATYLERPGRRVATLHAALNVGATAAFAMSWWMRRTRTGLGALATAQIGAAMATGAAALGGHLALSSGSDQ